MHYLNGAKFLNITFLFILFGLASAISAFATVIVPFASMYESLNLLLALKTVVLNLILIVLHLSFDQSVISTQFLILSLG